MLQNAHLLANIGFERARQNLAKIWQEFGKIRGSRVRSASASSVKPNAILSLTGGGYAGDSPALTEAENPKGFPIATHSCPTRAALSPSKLDASASGK